MSTPFIDRNPTQNEASLIRLAVSTFCDGSGQEREIGGGTRPGWRDFERSLAEVLHGVASESKDLFDVIIPADGSKDTFYGLSVKSKRLARRGAIGDLLHGGRVHLEVANSPAKFWDALSVVNLKEADFRAKKQADLFGNTVLQLVEKWHSVAAQKFDEMNRDKHLDLKKSVYIVVSYNKPASGSERMFQMHSFPLQFPKGIKWSFVSDKCLRGFDPADPEAPLIDWYAVSGGQLKYYPSTKQALFSTEQFRLAVPPRLSIIDRVKTYWPREWEENSLSQKYPTALADLE